MLAVVEIAEEMVYCFSWKIDVLDMTAFSREPFNYWLTHSRGLDKCVRQKNDDKNA